MIPPPVCYGRVVIARTAAEGGGTKQSLFLDCFNFALVLCFAMTVLTKRWLG